MNDSDDFLARIREDRRKRERRDMKITVAVLLVSLVVSSVLWVVLRG
jgi:hypothetical protein